MKKKTKLILWLVIAAVVISLLGYAIHKNIQREEAAAIRRAEEQAFQDGMKSAMANVVAANITGDKAVCLVLDDEDDKVGEYTTDHVPEAYQTKDPAQVRYLIRRVEDSENVGFYSGLGSALKHKYIISVIDLKLEETLEKTFYGGEPPAVVTGEAGKMKAYYGSEPNEEEITKWVEAALQGFDLDQSILEQQQKEAEEKAEQAAKEAEEAAAQQELYSHAMQEAYDLLSSDIGFGPDYLRYWLVEYEDCTQEEADYAVANCSADWNKQALKRLINKTTDTDYGGCSLHWFQTTAKEDGFTDENINYALQNATVDWNEQALITAEYMLADGIGYSPLTLTDFLTNIEYGNGFTAAEAQYALDHCEVDWLQQAVFHVANSLRYAEEVTGEEYTKDKMVEEMVLYYGFTEEQAIYGAEQNGLK